MVESVMRGRVAWKFGDFYNGDLIFGKGGATEPNRNPDNLKKYILTQYDPHFPEKFRKGDLMIAGKGFGGSRDHQSLKALKALGVSVVLAESFSRVILRRAILYALPALECKGITGFAEQGDELEVNIKEGWVRNLTHLGKELKCSPVIGPQLEILEAGDVLAFLRKKRQELQQDRHH